MKAYIDKLMKLKTCVIENNREKDRLIETISRASDRYGNKLIDFMSQYHLINLQSATVEQLKEYIKTHLQETTKMEI